MEEEFSAVCQVYYDRLYRFLLALSGCLLYTSYNRETLEVRYKGKNIYEVLEMTVDEALPFFENLPQIGRAHV